MAFFAYKGSKYAEKAVTLPVVILGSATVYVGGWTHLEDGNLADKADAADLLAGVIHKITSRDEIELSEAETSEYDGTLTAQSGSTAESYAAAADNATDRKVKVIINLDPGAFYSNTPDATIGSTTGSDSVGYFCDLITSVQADESDATTTAQQLAILGLDPADSSKGLYMKYQSQLG